MKIKNSTKLLSIIVIAASTYVVAGEQDEMRGSHNRYSHTEAKVYGGKNAYDMHDINGGRGNAFVQGDGNHVKPNYKPTIDKSWKNTNVSTKVKARLF